MEAIKTLKYIIIFILLISTVYAADFEYSITVTVDGDVVSTADEDGGFINVHRDSELSFRISMENNMVNDSEVDIEATIYDIGGTDLDRSLDFDIDADDKERKYINFIIPPDADNDIYDMELDIMWERANGSKEIEIVDFEIWVKDDEDKQEEVDLTNHYTEMYKNLTANYQTLQNEIHNCMGIKSLVGNTTDKLTSCQETHGQCLDTVDEWKENYRAKESDIDSLQLRIDDLEMNEDGLLSQIQERDSEINQLKSELSSRITRAQCNNQTAVLMEQTKSKNNNTMLFVAIAVGIGFFLYNKKFKTRSVSDQMTYTYKQ